MEVILHNYSLHSLIVLLVMITTAYGNPVCNKTSSIGNLSFYNTQESTSVVVGKYFHISCCAQLYDKIKWYHNKMDSLNRIKPNSIPKNCSQCFGQHEFRFAEGGQVLKVYDSLRFHAGIYFCSIKNGSVTKIFKQTVQVKLRNPENNSVIDLPTKMDSRCKQNVKAKIGDNVTLCCIFHGIKSENMDIRWETRTDHKNNRSLYLEVGDIATLADTTFVANVSVLEIKKQKSIWYEVTSFLTLYNLTMETYGTYIATSLPKQYYRQHGNCTITISPEADAESKLVTIVISMVMSFILVICMMTVLVSLYIWKRYHMTIWLFFSDLSPANDDMEDAMYDAFISHSNTDEDRLFAVQVLRPLLEKNNYTTCIDVVNFPAGGIRFDDGIAAVSVSRRCILVLSPDYTNNVHCRYELDAALEHMKNLRARCLKIIPIIFKNTSKHNINKSKHLDRVLVAVRKLKWTPDNVEYFEQKLVSRMGPIRIKKFQNNEDTSSDVRHSTDQYGFKTGAKRSFNRFYNPTNLTLNNIVSDLSSGE